MKYVIIGGFLGSGKTTSMIAFSKYLENIGVRAAILVNDLGKKDLVDEQFTQSLGCLTEQINGDCICYVPDQLLEKLRTFRDRDNADIIFSDIPGCGIGALDHVYHQLNKKHHGEFDLCPFVAICDPARLRAIMPQREDIHLPEEMEFLFDAQLKEAEVIILNKTDTVTEAENEELLAFLRSSYPDSIVFPMSAKTGKGVPEVVSYLMSHSSELRRPDIGYGSKAFIAAERKLVWYDRQLILKANEPFDCDDFIYELIEEIKHLLKEKNRNIPHLKIYAINENEKISKASSVGRDYDTTFDIRFDEPCSEIDMIINARAACEKDLVNEIIDRAILKTETRFSMSHKIYFTDSFSMS